MSAGRGGGAAAQRGRGGAKGKGGDRAAASAARHRRRSSNVTVAEAVEPIPAVIPAARPSSSSSSALAVHLRPEGAWARRYSGRCGGLDGWGGGHVASVAVVHLSVFRFVFVFLLACLLPCVLGLPWCAPLRRLRPASHTAVPSLPASKRSPSRRLSSDTCVPTQARRSLPHPHERSPLFLTPRSPTALPHPSSAASPLYCAAFLCCSRSRARGPPVTCPSPSSATSSATCASTLERRSTPRRTRTAACSHASPSLG